MLLVLTKCSAIQFIDNKVITCYPQHVIKDFHNIISSPLRGTTKADFSKPKVFVWSPQEQFVDCVIKCLAHDVPLVPWQFSTGEFGKKDWMPRLIFDLFRNVLLVQRMYLCKKRGHPHKIVSSCNDLLKLLPRRIQAIFPITMLSRSGCTNAVLDFINSNLIRGVSFATTCYTLFRAMIR